MSVFNVEVRVIALVEAESREGAAARAEARLRNALRAYRREGLELQIEADPKEVFESEPGTEADF